MITIQQSNLYDVGYMSEAEQAGSRERCNVQFYLCESNGESSNVFTGRYNEFARDILSTEIDSAIDRQYSKYVEAQHYSVAKQGVVLSEFDTASRPCNYIFPDIISNIFDDTAVLSPIKNGPCGTIGINEFLKSRLASWLGRHNMANTAGHAVLDFEGYNGWVLERGDRIACIANDYGRGVFNGEFGRVTDTGRWRNGIRYIRVHYYDINMYCSYSVGNDADTYKGHIAPSYAQTIHKSQGQEYKTVILILPNEPIHNAHELIYTAMTRASDRLVVMAGADVFKQSCTSEAKDREIYQPLKAKLDKAAHMATSSM